MICDRVAIVDRGRVVRAGALDEVVGGVSRASPDVDRVDGRCWRRSAASARCWTWRPPRPSRPFLDRLIWRVGIALTSRTGGRVPGGAARRGAGRSAVRAGAVAALARRRLRESGGGPRRTERTHHRALHDSRGDQPSAGAGRRSCSARSSWRSTRLASRLLYSHVDASPFSRATGRDWRWPATILTCSGCTPSTSCRVSWRSS